MNISALILKWAGWRVNISIDDYSKCIICVAPHTSNWDFVLGKLAYAAVGRHAGFLMKEQWFFWPLGYFFRSIGGVPVARKNKKISLTAAVTEMFKSRKALQLAITPEGTRSRNAKWHTGFLHIALAADVPIVLGVLDYANKEIIIKDTFKPSGDVDADLRAVKNYYKDFKGKYPEKFTTD